MAPEMSLLFLANATRAFFRSSFWFKEPLLGFLTCYSYHMRTCGVAFTSSKILTTLQQMFQHNWLRAGKLTLVYNRMSVWQSERTGGGKRIWLLARGKKNVGRTEEERKTRSSRTIGPVHTAGLCRSENPIKKVAFFHCDVVSAQGYYKDEVSVTLVLNGDLFVWPLEVLIMFWMGSKPISSNICYANTCLAFALIFMSFWYNLMSRWLSDWQAALFNWFILIYMIVHSSMVQRCH